MRTEASTPDHRVGARSAVAFDRTGSGAPLVLVHGLGGERHVWAPVIDRIADRRDVVTVDLPGFGESPPLSGGGARTSPRLAGSPSPAGDGAQTSPRLAASPSSATDGAPTPARLAEAVAGLLAELGLHRPHVAGNSLGGWVALELAKQGRAGAVTAIAPAGLWPAPLPPKPYVMHNLARAVRPLVPALMASTAGRRLALGGTVAHPERIPPAAAVRMAEAYAASPGFVAVNDAMRAGHLVGGEHIWVPVTVAWCEHDRLVSRPRVMPVRAHEVVLRGCGHVPMHDDPDAVAALVRS
jgi:pimeloyl-ACP methyl ester carboxylesterase